MPIVKPQSADAQSPEEVLESQAEARLVDEDGAVSPEAEVMAAFLEAVDFSDVLKDEALQEYASTEKQFIVPVGAEQHAIMSEAELEKFGEAAGKKFGPKNGKKYRIAEDTGLVDAKDDAGNEVAHEADYSDGLNWDALMVEDAEGVAYNDEDGILACEAEVIPGWALEAVVDMDDLMEMFAQYCADELPTETLEEQAIFSRFADLYDADTTVDEGKSPFKRGNFRNASVFKGAKKGSDAYNVRVRMMTAMLRKGVIKRVAKGHGYKHGDYQYRAGGAPSTAGLKAYNRVAKRNYRRAGEIKKMVGKARGKVVALIYQNMGKKRPANWTAPEARLQKRRASAAAGIKGSPSGSTAAAQKGVSTGHAEKRSVKHALGQQLRHAERKAAAGKMKAQAKAAAVKQAHLAAAAKKHGAKPKPKKVMESAGRSHYERTGLVAETALLAKALGNKPVFG